MARKIAVVLMNLGGPDGPDSVQPFLQNLFSDPAIIRTNALTRWLLARLISYGRKKEARRNYAMMDAGGGSPLLGETKKQAGVLRSVLQGRLAQDEEVRIFIAMRYWHPFTQEAAKEVKDWAPDECILLPLYPHYSTTTTGSSLTEWEKHYSGPCKTICCYPFNEDLIDAHIGKIKQAYSRIKSPENPVLLLSAHGLPEQIIEAGDPYQWQIEQMSEMLRARLPDSWEIITCYQSRVGRLKWIEPATEDVIAKAAQAQRHIVVAPVAFVSEHIETLVELGEEYRLIAEKEGAASYICAQALGTDEQFMTCLADQIIAALEMTDATRLCNGGRICPAEFKACPYATEKLNAV